MSGALAFYTLAVGSYPLIAEGRFQSNFCDYHLMPCQRWPQEEGRGGEEECGLTQLSY